MKLDGAIGIGVLGEARIGVRASHLARDILADFFEVWLAEIPFFEFDWKAGNVPKAWHPRPYPPSACPIFDGWVPECVPLRW